MIGLFGVYECNQQRCDAVIIPTHEYHSHAEYSVLTRSETVLKPEWDVFDEAINSNSPA